MFAKFKQSLAKTLENFSSHSDSIDKETLEELLIEADVSYELVEIWLDKLGSKVKKEQLEALLLENFEGIGEQTLDIKPPLVDIIIGVNGAGKTTTIAKLAHHYKQQGKSVFSRSRRYFSSRRHRATIPMG